MNPRRRYRQLFLFVIVLTIPSALVISQGWRLLSLDLANRNKKAKENAAVEIGKELRAALENIKSEEIHNGSTSSGLIKFVGWDDNGRIVMPWELDPNVAATVQSLSDPDFIKAMDEGDRLEFVDPDKVAPFFLNLIQTAMDEHQRAEARVELASFMRRTGGVLKAEGVYRDLLGLNSTLVNRDGIPYAATAALALAAISEDDVFARVMREMESLGSLTLPQTYRWKDILETLQSDWPANPDLSAALNKLQARISALEAMQKDLERDQDFEQLQKDLAAVRPTDKAWQPYGTNLMLSEARVGTRRMIVGVQQDKIFELARASRPPGPPFEIAAFRDEGEPLDKVLLPDLNVIWVSPTVGENPAFDIKRSWYPVALLLVLGVNLLGAYFLWRDTRREVRTAELRSQFVSGVSHELKTPLTAIRMFAEILQSENSVDPQSRRECLDTIVNESERLTRLLNNVLDFSRIERGQKTYRMEPTRLADVVSSAVKTMQFPLAEQGFDLQMEIGDTPPVDGDRDALKQAVLNLLTNAMKYSGTNRGIELRLLPQNGDALIQVTDHGIGIPHAEQSRIFQRFYRAAVPENQSISGTGLGLALVAHVAEAHGGSVQVKSSPGAGSTFSIRIPVHPGGAS